MISVAIILPFYVYEIPILDFAKVPINLPAIPILEQIAIYT